jgi:nucleoid-associated protein YgaU
MSVASEFPPDVYIPDAARPRSLYLATPLPVPAAPAAAALGAEVIDLDRWRHHLSDVTVGRSGGAVRGDTVAAHVGAAAVSLRLTRRGMAVLTSLALAIAAVFVMVAWLSAPAGADVTGVPGAPAVVTVQSGDSLWSIAREVAPSRDPRAEIDHLRNLNHLGEQPLVPGQTLRTR